MPIQKPKCASQSDGVRNDLPMRSANQYLCQTMRWISVLALLFFLTGASGAAGPDDQYLDIYNQILQADNLQQNGHTKEAVAIYSQAQSALTALKQANPTW